MGRAVGQIAGGCGNSYGSQLLLLWRIPIHLTHLTGYYCRRIFDSIALENFPNSLAATTSLKD
ncbi:hypothetical protein U1Q18_001624 [Sarracenia purpurea var. burkii]